MSTDLAAKLRRYAAVMGVLARRVAAKQSAGNADWYRGASAAFQVASLLAKRGSEPKALEIQPDGTVRFVPNTGD